jgi:uncharacterized membrane protein
MNAEDKERKERSLLYREVGFYKARATSYYNIQKFYTTVFLIIIGIMICSLIIGSKLSDQWKVGLLTLLTPVALGALKITFSLPSPEKDFNDWMKREAEESNLRDTIKRSL